MTKKAAMRAACQSGSGQQIARSTAVLEITCLARARSELPSKSMSIDRNGDHDCIAPPVSALHTRDSDTKVPTAEDSWNTCNPEKVSLEATRLTVAGAIRSQFVAGRPAIVAFLWRKWLREMDRRLVKDSGALTMNGIAVRFAYEWHDDSGNWFRSCGNENCHCNDSVLTEQRHASINGLPIREGDRKFVWDRGRPCQPITQA